MRRTYKLTLALAAALMLGILAGLLNAQDAAKPKQHLPTGWSKNLKLTPAQKTAMYKISADNSIKIADLQKQISDIRASERREMAKLLTDEQKVTLKRMLGVE